MKDNAKFYAQIFWEEELYYELAQYNALKKR